MSGEAEQPPSAGQEPASDKTPAEALTAATLNGALALGRSNRGAIAPDWRADLLVCDVPDYRHLTYHFGINHVETVIIGGRVVNA